MTLGVGLGLVLLGFAVAGCNPQQPKRNAMSDSLENSPPNPDEIPIDPGPRQ